MSLESGFVDLHCHSTASDGTLPPRQVVELAARQGLVGLALTDHDTVAGLAEARATAEALKIEFLTGIEISCAYPSSGTLHILGYGIDPGSAVLGSMTAGLREARDDRNPRIIARLNELGVSISMVEVAEQAAGGVVGRPHIAAVLVKKGYVSSIKQAFDKYLGQGGSAYFDKERLEFAHAVKLIHDSGGLAGLAHPIQLRTQNDAQLDLVVKNLKDQGLDCIEVLHSDHDAAWVEKTEALAKRYNLLKTGGSDFHGQNKPAIGLGWANGRRIPAEWMAEIQRKLQR